MEAKLINRRPVRSFGHWMGRPIIPGCGKRNVAKSYGVKNRADHIYTTSDGELLSVDYSLSYVSGFRILVSRIIRLSGSLSTLGQNESSPY